MKDTEYQLIMTEEQLQIISYACEFYSRMKCGQMMVLRELIAFDKDYGEDFLKNIHKYEDAIDKLQGFLPRKALTSDRDAEIAWNAHQSMRSCEAWYNHPNGGTTVDFNPVIDIGGVGIPRCVVANREEMRGIGNKGCR